MQQVFRVHFTQSTPQHSHSCKVCRILKKCRKKRKKEIETKEIKVFPSQRKRRAPQHRTRALGQFMGMIMVTILPGLGTSRRAFKSTGESISKQCFQKIPPGSRGRKFFVWAAMHDVCVVLCCRKIENAICYI